MVDRRWATIVLIQDDPTDYGTTDGRANPVVVVSSVMVMMSVIPVMPAVCLCRCGHGSKDQYCCEYQLLHVMHSFRFAYLTPCSADALTCL